MWGSVSFTYLPYKQEYKETPYLSNQNIGKRSFDKIEYAI
jgi:hypothetical protein